MTFAFFTVREVQTASAQSVGLSYYTAISAPAISITYDAHAKDDTPWYTILCSVYTAVLCTSNVFWESRREGRAV